MTHPTDRATLLRLLDDIRDNATTDIPRSIMERIDDVLDAAKRHGTYDDGACGHESMTGLGHPRLWSCDGCGQITVEVDDTTGPCSDGTRRWRHEVIGSVDVKAARKFGPPMPATPADDAVREALRGIKAMALCHHAHEDGATLLHALLVEIPTAIDDALTRTATPADDAVARARERFEKSGSAWARHQFECPGAAFEGPGPEWFVENDALRIRALHDHDALLAAERAERDAAGGQDGKGA